MKPAYQPALYRSPINLPERSSGKISVRHRIVKEKTPIIGMRQAYTRGVSPLTVKLTAPLKIHELTEGDGVWMTDLPEELNQIGQMIYEIQPRGRVLVGGLGLGIVARTLAALDQVLTVTVVEKNSDVIKLCADENFRVVHDDIKNFLQTTNLQFDYFLLDTWAGTNESTWWGTVLPLRRIIRNRFGAKRVIHCWAEDIMLGQVTQSLLNPLNREAWFYNGLPPMNETAAEWFVRYAGSREWERKYGKIVDANYAGGEAE